MRFLRYRFLLWFCLALFLLLLPAGRTSEIELYGSWALNLPLFALKRLFAGVAPSAGISPEQRLLRENRQLRGRLAMAEAEIARLERELARITAFRSRYPAVKAHEIVPARVISPPDLSSLERVMTLDVGREQGVDVGMAVLEGACVVGRIEQVTRRFCRVRLLTDPTFKLRCVVAGKGEEGILEGGSDREIIFRPRASGVSISEGDVLLSAERSTILPSGVVVGEVAGIARGEGGREATVRVRPGFDVQNLSRVVVLKRKARRGS
jgi:rod shape-determining protein MreC